MGRVAVTAGVLAAALAVLWIPVGGRVVEREIADRGFPVRDLSEFSADPPGLRLRFLFIHHSCGGQWMAESGPDDGDHCIYRSHPNGGGMRRSLEQAGYEIHEASYGSAVGAKTDIFDWLPKFRDQMDQVLSCEHQDVVYADGRQNHIVAFKSCYPNSLFAGDDVGPGGETDGNPAGPELTVANAQAAYRALLPEFSRNPQTLFVCVTAPPVAPQVKPSPLWKQLARAVLLRPSPEKRRANTGGEARRFNDWLKSTEGWLKDYPAQNVVVFDLFDVLTNEGASNFSRYPTRDGYDSHPSRAGNEKATQAFVPFLNRAVHRAGLSGPSKVGDAVSET